MQLFAPVAQVPVALADGRIGVIDLWRFDMLKQYLQKFLRSLRFQSCLLFVHPASLTLRVGDDGLGGGAEVVAHMVEVEQVAALRAKLVFHLIGYPRRAVADGMDLGAPAKSGQFGARK